jgi:hypothetical protein
MGNVFHIGSYVFQIPILIILDLSSYTYHPTFLGHCDVRNAVSKRDMSAEEQEAIARHLNRSTKEPDP